jgi:hypothetical protein
VSELLADADFNGQPVMVTGTMSNFRGNPLRRTGPRYTFDLGDGVATVHVISFAKPACESGARDRRGHLRGGEAGASELLLRGNHRPQVICPPSTVDPRGAKGK